MKNFFTFSLILFCSLQSFAANAADTYKIDPNHTSVIWSANHFGFSSPSGKFSDIEGTITIDENNLQQSSVEITIKTSSMTTGFSKFDEHLKGSDFFNVASFPTAKFVSTSIVPSSKTNARVNGKLTFLGITQFISLDVKLNKKGLNPINQKQTIGFSATANIRRSDFKMNFGLPNISDNVKLTIEAEGIIANLYSPNAIPEWKIIPSQSKIEFQARQDNSIISGSFKKFDGQIIFDRSRNDNSKIAIEIDTGSVDISFLEALETLKSSPWLAVQDFPKAIFTADQFVPMNNNSFRAIGKLSIKGKVAPVTLDFTLNKYSNEYALATGTATIKRSDFAIGDRDIKKANDVQDQVVVTVTISASRK